MLAHVICDVMLKLSRNPARNWNEVIPFNSARCGEPFSNKRMIENVWGKLDVHSMLASGSLKWPQICADCRVLDIMENKSEQIIFEAKR